MNIPGRTQRCTKGRAGIVLFSEWEEPWGGRGREEASTGSAAPQTECGHGYTITPTGVIMARLLRRLETAAA